MPPATHVLTMPGPLLQRGFWLYVWRVEAPVGEKLYVGRTGDNSSPHASAPYQRLGQHLGRVKSQNALKRQLEKAGIALEDCANFHFIAHGPIWPETIKAVGADRAAMMLAHTPIRDLIAPMEKALAHELSAAGYDVLNTVSCKAKLNLDLWAPVRAAFAEHFPMLRRG